MECLIFLSPAMESIVIALTVMIVFGIFGLGFIVVAINECQDEKYKAFMKKLVKGLSILLLFIFILAIACGIIARSWEGYKRVLIYRTINSKTTEKAIKNIELLLDKVEGVAMKYKLRQKVKVNVGTKDLLTGIVTGIKYKELLDIEYKELLEWDGKDDISGKLETSLLYRVNFFNYPHPSYSWYPENQLC